MPNLSKRATLLKEYKAIAASHSVKAYISFCFDDKDSSENEIDRFISAELVVSKSSRYIFHGSY